MTPQQRTGVDRVEAPGLKRQAGRVGPDQHRHGQALLAEPALGFAKHGLYISNVLFIH